MQQNIGPNTSKMVNENTILDKLPFCLTCNLLKYDMQNLEQKVETKLAYDLGKNGYLARQIGRGRRGAVKAFILDHSISK